jgi:hypothetical protein
MFRIVTVVLTYHRFKSIECSNVYIVIGCTANLKRFIVWEIEWAMHPDSRKQK